MVMDRIPIIINHTLTPSNPDIIVNPDDDIIRNVLGPDLDPAVSRPMILDKDLCSDDIIPTRDTDQIAVAISLDHHLPVPLLSNQV